MIPQGKSTRASRQPAPPTEAAIITIVNAKGGVGKTTATVYLAAALLESGLSVEVWDADPQGSATAWLDAAGQGAEAGAALFHTPANVASIGTRSPRADVVLIDTPPGTPALQDAAVARADLVIVPTSHSALDMIRMWETLDTLDPKARAVVLMNLCLTQATTYTRALETLDAEGQAHFTTTVARRETYKRAYGRLPDQLGEWAGVAAELRTMIQEVKTR